MKHDATGASIAPAREVYALFNARDAHAIHDVLAPDVVWDWSRSLGPDAGVRHGRAAVLRFFATHWEHWASIEFSPISLVDVEGVAVVDVEVRLGGRDGIELTVRGGHVQVWDDEGRLARYILFQSLDEATEFARAPG